MSALFVVFYAVAPPAARRRAASWQLFVRAGRVLGGPRGAWRLAFVLFWLPQRLAAALEPPNPRGMSAAWSRLRGFLRLVNPFSEASPDLFREGKREEQAEVCGA